MTGAGQTPAKVIREAGEHGIALTDLARYCGDTLYDARAKVVRMVRDGRVFRENADTSEERVYACPEPARWWLDAWRRATP
jgi:hypothetical protein